MNKTKRSLFTSLISLLLCFTTLLGTTFAWFTDVSFSKGNIIETGNLDAKMYWANDFDAPEAEWTNAEDGPVFNYDNWEPGYTDVKYVKVKNEGNLAFKWQLSIKAENEMTKLSDVIDVYYVNPISANLTSLAGKTNVGNLTDVVKGRKTTSGALLPSGTYEAGYITGETVLAIALHMDEDAGNEYKNLSLGEFELELIATQLSYESDDFGNGYDTESKWPDSVITGDKVASAPVTPTADNKVDANGVSIDIDGGKYNASVPEGTKLDNGTDKLTLVINNVDESQANITLNENEASLSLDVHVYGIAADNDKVIKIYMAEKLPKGLNMGNYRFYHVENGVTNEMTYITDPADAAHNTFEYDPNTGDVVIYLKSFSEVALVADTTKAWTGGFDYSWYDADATKLTIANADQLAAFGAIVGDMTEAHGQNLEQDSFEGKTITLLADINLGDKESENNPDLIFHPIGYWNNEGTYERKPADERVTAVSSGFYTFEGTFDGNGNTISNFYQNTWEIKGDHNWYDPIKEQYFRDGMGLFGRIYKGTVKNLTVKNFSSDGEITTTGTIAAYAEGATFENIAIFNCNPRVYNIGNGGIVGCVGWYAKEADLTTTFKNITVDNSNKISALWGTYDAACGGIVGQYYPTSGQTSAGTPKNAGIHFENCHISAQMDVYNDVCANYQYYAYRYTGMLIGSVRENVTIDGRSYPNMDGITAKGCTVHFGTWNDYYYCEIIDNTIASYTHDYQMSRLTEIKAINGTTITYLDGTTGTVPTSGRANYVIVDYTKGHGTENATCYHFKDGAVWTHDMGGIQTGIDENGDGKDDLKEDKQHLYLEFNNLVTGYGWGVTSKGVGDLAGVTILDREVGNSVEKFESKVTELKNKKTYKLGDIFSFVNKGVELVPGALVIGITNLDENNPVSATVVYDRTNWENSTITFNGAGTITITIQDYYFCTPTTITVDVTDRQPEVKFDVVMNNGDFLHRVGNVGTVALDKLFKAKDGVTVGTVTVAVEAVDGTSASGTYSNNAIQFNDTGVVKVTITDNDYCIPTVLYLEVVDAMNVTGLSGTISGNVVLLNDCGLNSLTVSGRNVVYGNGFTATYSGNGQYLNNGLKQGVVTVSENGTLDNLRIVAPVYPKAYMYYGSTQLGDYVQGGPSSVEGDKTRYHYQLSSVVAKGNATISNCYIYGGRTNVFIDTGDVTIKDTILECGTVANVQIQSNISHTITLEDVTTIQYLVDSNVSETTSAKMLGVGILVGPETTDNPNIVLNGYLKQYNWVTADDAKNASGKVAPMIVNAALGATDFNHTIKGKTASNLGIIYMNEYESKIENNTGLLYEFGTVSISGVNGKVYSVKNATSEQIYSDYANADRTTVNGWYQPQFKYDANLGGQYIEKDSGDEHFYREGDTINVMFPSGDTKEIDLAALVNIVKYSGQNLNLAITCKDENGNAVTVTDGKITLSTADKYTVTYTVTDTLFYDKDGNTVKGSINYSWDVTISVSLKDTKVPDARFEFDATKQKMGYYKPSWGDVKQYLPFLAGLKIYDYNGKTEYLRFDGSSDFNKVASVTITGYSSNKASVEIKLTDGGVINTQFLARANSGGGSTYTGKIKTSNNTIYFVTDSGTSNKDTTTTAAYWYVDYYKFTGNNGVAIQSAQQTFNSTGSSASTPSGNFSTSIKATVTYDPNGGNCGQTTGYATSVSAAVTLPTPTRSGYIFAGWYTAASGGTRVGGAGATYTPSANITLYAQWGKPCTVTYNANGGSCGTASEKYTGTALTLPTPTRDGYWFVGWYDAAEGGNKKGDAGATYTPSGEITLYAHWQEKVEYTVTYNANGGTCGTASATYQGTALTLPTPTQTGYTFNGWYTSASGGTRVGGAGDSYTPSANITLYAQWQINSYTITVTTSNATVQVNGNTVNNNGTVSVQYGAQVTVEVTYSKSDNRSTTITGTDGKTYTSPFTMPAQDVTISATSSECVTPDTLITLADGTQVRVDSLTGNEELLVWNMETGKFDKAPIMFIDSEEESEYEIIKLCFSDGTEVKVIAEHGFWDYDLNKYVYLDRYADKYIGHTFAKQNGDSLEKVTLVDVVIETEITTAWSPVTVGHLCYFVNGMLSMPGGVGGLFNIFEVDAETMTYDYEQLEKDIETYGLYTYEELNAICPLTEEMFYAAGGAYLKISIGKGNLTIEELINMINRYSKFI